MAQNGTVSFRHDIDTDIYFAHPKWYIETEDDCRVWHSQFEAYFSRIGRKVDVVIVLDDFKFGPRIGTIWGKYRADWITRFTRFSVRVHGDGRLRTFTATSSAQYGGGYEEAASVEAAVQMIQARRLEAGSK